MPRKKKIKENEIEFDYEDSKSKDKVHDATDITYFTKISNKHHVLSPEEERNLFIAYKADPNSKEGKARLSKIVAHNQRWVINIAKKYLYQRRSFTFQDLIMAGNIGLMKAIEKFEVEKGFKFSTYATWWIRQSITRDLADFAKTIRIPINVCGDYVLVQKLYGGFAAQEEGRRPNNEELTALYDQASQKEKTEWLKLPKEKREKKKLKLKPRTAEGIAELGSYFLPVESLDIPKSEDENLTLLDYLYEEEERQPEIQAESSYDRVLLKKLLSILEPAELNFINLRFGLVDKGRDRKTMAVINKMTPEDVAIKEKAILNKMLEFAKSENMSTAEVLKSFSLQKDE